MSTTTSITKPEKMPEGDFANYFCTYGARRSRPR